MDPLHRIAERRIEEAAAAGWLDDYPGKGEPLEVDDLAWMDPELRAAYSLLKGHGYVSEESELRARIASIHALLAGVRDDDSATRDELAREQRDLRSRFATLLEARRVPPQVIERLLAPLERD